MNRLLLLLPALLLIPAWASGQDSAPRDTVFVSERFVAWGEPIMGAEVFGKFHSDSLRAEVLRLDRVVGTLQNRPVALSDILLSVDLDGLGPVASWRVVGPAVLVRTYLAALERGRQDRSLFYDFGWSPLAAEFCCGGH